MNLTESVRVALRALGANKLRAALTMLGMIIGVGAVIALMSIGQGVQASVTSQIKGLGSNLLFVTPGATTSGGVRAQAGSAPTLTSEDADAIVDSGQVPQAVAVAPEAGNFGQVVANGQNTFTRLNGVTPDFLGVRNFSVAEGEFFSPEQISSRSLVAVLGATSRQNLFAESDAIGQTVRVNNVNLRVIGVMASKGAQAQGNQDDVIYVPLSTMQTRLNRNRTARGGQTVQTINVQLADDQDETRVAAVQSIGELLRERHRVAEDDFTIRSQDDLLQTANQIAGFITIFLGSVAGISLLVGGIGIMNIMLVSVTERTREIGIRKAIGAKRSDILTQFLIEATVVSVVGGAIGILIGAGGSRLLNGLRLGGPGAQPIQTVVSPDAILLAFTVSALIGLFFGVYPAVKASRLNPIEALRYE
ncbi:MAG TPA: ABC transporter permease [Chloroflexota bacterium]|jgi:putative ABC transport system permease protein|nr:ABC transporter permease [Chloroflexota bacterium]